MMSDISVTTNEAGDHFVGFEVDGTFIPFASVSANRIAQLQERAANLAELAAEEGEGAKGRHADAANALPYKAGSSKSSAGKTTGKGGE